MALRTSRLSLWHAWRNTPHVRMPHAALLEQLVSDCFDEEQYEAAIDLIDTLRGSAWAPSG